MNLADTTETEAPSKKKERGPCGTPRSSRGKKIRTSVLLKRTHKAQHEKTTLKAFARSGVDIAAQWFANKKKSR